MPKASSYVVSTEMCAEVMRCTLECTVLERMAQLMRSHWFKEGRGVWVACTTEASPAAAVIITRGRDNQENGDRSCFSTMHATPPRAFCYFIRLKSHFSSGKNMEQHDRTFENFFSRNSRRPLLCTIDLSRTCVIVIVFAFNLSSMGG